MENKDPRHYRNKGFRSELEGRVHDELVSLNYKFDYENQYLEYQINPQKYYPDFEINRPDYLLMRTYLEVKGNHRYGGLDLSTRRKMIAVKKNNPFARIIFIFEKPGCICQGTKKTTFEDFAEKNGFEYYYSGKIPKDIFNSYEDE
jgi:hypothetical protein